MNSALVRRTLTPRRPQEGCSYWKLKSTFSIVTATYLCQSTVAMAPSRVYSAEVGSWLNNYLTPSLISRAGHTPNVWLAGLNVSEWSRATKWAVVSCKWGVKVHAVWVSFSRARYACFFLCLWSPRLLGGQQRPAGCGGSVLLGHRSFMYGTIQGWLASTPIVLCTKSKRKEGGYLEKLTGYLVNFWIGGPHL